MDNDSHARIAARAHALWEAAGRPLGQDDTFWFQAVNEAKDEGFEASNHSTNIELRQKGNVIDQRQQQIDPAGRHRDDPNAIGARRSQKQSGQSLDNPQDIEGDGK